MRKEVPRDSVASRPTTKPASTGKAVKRAAAPSSGKTVVKKKKVEESNPGNSDKLAKKKKLLKAKVVLTKLTPGAQEQTKPKVVKETKKETIPKTVKPKPKKVIVSKAAKKGVKLEHDPKRATKAKIVRAVKDVKKAKSLVASKMAKTSPKKPVTSEKASKGVNLVKKHKIVKSVNKMSGKKPCVVSVKISNAHSTVTLSVKQNKQVAKKDNSKNAKPCGEKGSDRSTISIVKKGIASRRKSASKDGTSQESSPSQSPTRSVSPGKGSNIKSKKSENLKTQKKNVKETDSKKVVDDKSVSNKNNDSKIDNEKTEYIINDSVKIKTENVGEQQNMEIEFTDGSMTDKNNDSKDESKDSSKKDDSVFEFKAKSPLRDYNNLKSIESCTSDEMPLEILKCKERIKQEKESSCKKNEAKDVDKVDLDRVKSEDGKKKESTSDEKQTVSKKKADSAKQIKSKVPTKTLKSAKQADNDKEKKIQEKSKDKLKDLALKQKVAKIVKKSRLTEQKQKKVADKVESEESSTGSSNGSERKRMKKLYKFWSGPKRHRVASLNAIAKVHCLYENESRSALNDVISNAAILQRAIEESKKEYAASKEKMKGEEKEKKVVPKRSATEKKPAEVPVGRSLRTNPGVRSVGRNFDILNVISSTSLSSSSSSEESSDSGEEKKQLALPPSVKQKQAQIKKEESDQTSDEEPAQKPSPESNEDNKDGTKKVKKRRRRRNELTMDLKDMVVRKRMASLNASAIMTATYSTEKKLEIKPEKDKEKKKIEEAPKKERKKKKKQPVTSPEADDSSAEDEEDVILRTTNSNKQKVAVIVNQDTDVTITGVYVNSTTRSTHHEGYCSIAGMQYRISSTSHTQTEATAVSTETVLHSDHPPCLPEVTPTTALATPCKSYTPLTALSSMQPPGQMHHHAHPPGTCPPPRAPSLSPLQRRHGCTSAFSAPPNYPQPGPPPPPHPDVHGNYRWEVEMPCCSVPPPRLCYYQPAGPLISTHHHHHHTTSSSITSKLQPPPLPSPTPPPSSTHPTSHSESSDNEVVLTSTSAAENPPPARYSNYPPPPHGQPYNPQYYQYYPSPPASSLQYPGQQNHYHQDICYSAPSGYPPGYFPKGHYPPPPGGYPRRYQYYPPQEYYPPPGNPQQPPPSGNNQQMMVSAANPPSGQTSTSYPPPGDGNYPSPAPMVDPYPPPPPPQPGYYPGYNTGPPPSCYTTHSPSSRGIFLDPAYQGCPCPMQSCPKNVHTGPLTGASKGSIKNHQTSHLAPVALALPQEPPGALGPPSPARGSAGMPPPPSPALATACNPPQWAELPSVKPPLEQTGLLTISKMVTDAVMLAEQGETNLTELLPRTEPIKQEIEDIVKIEVIEDAKCNRKRRKSFKSSPVDIKRQSCEPMPESELKVEVQERLTTLKEEPEKTPSPELETVEKQLPLSDNGATVPVKNSCVADSAVCKEHPKKRKLASSESEVPAKVAKCTKSPKVVKKKCVKRSKSVTEENIAPVSDHHQLTVSAAELVKVECRRSSKSVERRKSGVEPSIQQTTEEQTEGKKKKAARTKKLQGKTKADHQLRSHGKPETATPGQIKERRQSKAGSVKAEDTTGTGKGKKAAAGTGVAVVAELDPSAESQVCLPGLRRSLVPRWSNGWAWEGTPYKAKVFLNMDDKEVVRKCYPAMRHAQGDVIYPRDSILLKAGPRKIDLPFVAKVAAMWENPDDGEMMVSLLWYYRPEHTEQGRRPEDSPDEIFASRHKDTNSVACIEDKCFVLSFNEYCRYRKTVRRLEEGLSGGGMVVPALEEGGYPRSSFQPPGIVSPDLVFFCRRVYDFRQKRILKNPC